MSDTEAKEGFDNFYSICGFLGGLIFAISLLPQLWKTYSSKSATDLSYFWQFAYLLGLAGLAVYCIPYQLWPMLAPAILDFALMAILTGMKYYYDNIYPERSTPKVKETNIEEVDVNGINIHEPCEEVLDVSARKRSFCSYAQGFNHLDAQCPVEEQGHSDQSSATLRTGQQEGIFGPDGVLAPKTETLAGSSEVNR